MVKVTFWMEDSGHKYFKFSMKWLDIAAKHFLKPCKSPVPDFSKPHPQFLKAQFLKANFAQVMSAKTLLRAL